MGVETWNDGYVNVWEGTTDRAVHLTGWGNHTVRSSNKAVTYLTIYDGAGNDDISVGALNTTIVPNSGSDRYYIESGINATIYNGNGYKEVGSNYLAGSLNIYETDWWSARHVDVSAFYSYVQTGNGSDYIKAYGLSQVIVEDAGGNNTLDLDGPGYIKADLGWGSVKTGVDTVHLWKGWNIDILKSGGSLYVYNHEYHGGETKIGIRGGNTVASLDELGYYDGRALAHNIDLRVNKFANINAYGLSRNYINLWGSDGNSRMNIESPGSNEIWATHGNDDINIWMGGSWTEVNLDTGNDNLFINSGVSGRITMGRGDKHIRTNYLAGNLDVLDWGGSGNRDINVKAGSVYVNLWGADGSSQMNIESLVSNSIWATHGNDDINIWMGGSWTEVNLDTGNDNLFINSGVSGKITMGRGDKHIRTNYLAGNLDVLDWGGSGNRDINVQAGNVYVQSGSGNDTITVTGLWTAKIEDEGGNNTVDVRGAGVNVRTGHGNDSIYVSGVAAKVASGNGDDSITLDGLDARLYDADTWGNKNVIARAGGAYLYTGNGNDNVEFYGLGTHVETGAGNDNVVVRGVGAYVNTGSGNDTVDLRTAGDEVYTGDGNDTVWSLGVGGQKVDLGDGDDSLEAYGGTNVIYAGRNGKKTIKVGGGLNVVQVGHGDSTVEAYGGLNVVLTGHGNNAVNAYGGSNFLLNGNGHYTANAYGGLNVVLSGLGQAEINAYGSTNIVMAGDKGNTIRGYGVGYMTGIGNLVISGSGDDRIKVGGLLAAATTQMGVSSDEFAFDRIVVVGKDAGDTIGKTALNVLSLVANAAFNAGNIVIAGDGNNKVKAYGGYNFVQTGSGDDEVSMVGGLNAAVVGNGRNRIFAIGGNNIAVAGSGDDEMQAIGAANVFFANAGNNRMTAIGNGNLFVTADGNDDILAFGGANIAIMGGGNNTALLAGGYGNLVQGGSGDDRVLALSQWNVMVLGNGNNTVGALGGGGNLVWTGSGNDTVISLGLYVGNILLLGDGNNFAISGGRANIVIAGSGRDSVLSVGQYNLVSTANGIDNVISIGEYNLVHTGGDDDIAAVVGKINFVDTGWGNDVALVIGKTNIVFTEAGDDTALVIGQNNYVFSGSGNDMVAVFGETNYVLTGSGHDLVAVFGKKNVVATDNQIVFTDDDLQMTGKDGKKISLKESKQVKSFNDKGDAWSEKTGLDVSTEAELKLSADLAVYFPDIEFSTPQSSDWKYQTLTLPSYSYQIPSTPALRSAPNYVYGKLGDYGLPSLSFPMLSSPELQLPGITIPSFSIPNLTDIGVQVDQLKPNFFMDFNVGSDWFGGLSSGFQSLTGLPSSGSGSSNTLLGGRVSLQPNLSGDVGFNHADLTGKVSGSSQANVNAVVASGAANADGKASASTSNGSSASGSVFGSGNVFGTQGADKTTGSTSGASKDKFLMVDGSANSADAFWKQTIPLVAGADYTFSFWAASGTDPQPQLQLYLDGTAIGAVQTLSKASGWTQYSVNFKAGSSGAQVLSLKDLTTDAGGNDFALDRLSLSTSANLLKNSSFTDGSNGFTSDYTVQAQAAGAKTMGVVEAPPAWGLGVSTGQGASGGARDKFLMVDGSTNSADAFWKQTIPLVAGADYTFSFWAASGTDPQPQLQLYLDGTAIGAVQTLSKASGWTQYSVNFKAGSSGAQVLSLKDLTTDAGGNDFALDSLSLTSSANFVTNGGFSAGNSGFTSDYTLQTQAAGEKTAAVTDTVPDWGLGVTTGLGDGQVGTSSNANSVEYALPTLSFGDIKLPNLQLNGFDFSGYSKLFTTLFSGRDLYGVTLPEFTMPEFKVDNFNLSDYVGGTQALTIKGMSYTLPSLYLPKIAGIDYQSRLPNLKTTYQFNQGEGDVAVVGGQDNRVMTGPGDDLALVMGETNALFMGDGNDAALMVGKDNAWRGGAGNDFILAAGESNAIKGNDGNDILFVLGETNKVEGGSGDDVVVALGKTNDVDAGAGKDLMLIVGQKNNINCKADDSTGDGNDTILVLGQENNVKGGRGDDWLIACGATNTIDGGQGNDVVVAAGWKNTLYGDFGSSDNGNDVMIFIGGANKVQGNGGNDVIIGAGLGNSIEGNAGNDIVLAAGLGQNIDTGDGDDIAVALGAGNQISAGAGQDTVYIAGALGNAFGGSGDDVLFALGAGNLLWGQEGNDVFLAQGIASRCLATDGKLPAAVSAINMALDRINGISQGISSESVPASLNDYTRQDNTNTYAYGASGNDVFYSGFQNVLSDGGEGLDTYHYYLGDGRMTVRDCSAEADKLVIHAEQLSSFGSNATITAANLFYDSSSKTLSVVQSGLKYGDILFDGFGTSSDQIELRNSSGSSTINLSGLSSYSGAATTAWTPSVTTNSASFASADFTSLYDTLKTNLSINAAVL